MICAIGFHQGDVGLAKNLLTWIGQLGARMESHHCLLVADYSTDYKSCLQCLDLAKAAFTQAELISTEAHVEGWIPGSNDIFKTAARRLQGHPFLFMEPDATPLKADWLDAIWDEYRQLPPGAYMGAVVAHDNPKWPNPYLEGNAVYPPDAYEAMSPSFRPEESWTKSCASIVMPKAVNSVLFQHLWGKASLAPTFREQNVPGTNVFCVRQLKPEVRLFHRCKDGSLIRELRRSAGIPAIVTPITTVFSFCRKDAKLMLKSMQWMLEISPRLERRCVLHYDGDVNPETVRSISETAKAVFSTVIHSKYQTPKSPYLGWPAACNWAFIMACRAMEQKIKGPWFWFEADAVSVTGDWLEQIEKEYAEGGKPFMGTRIGDFDGLRMGHINGTAVYPENAASYIPKALANHRYPWDAGMRDEMIQFAHFSNRIMQHCGAVIDGKCKPANGPQAKFTTQADVDRLLDPEAVFFHPSKDGTLIDRLMERNHGKIR